MKKILLLSFAALLLLGSCNKNEEPSDVYDEGIEINGVVWATRNVGKPGTFAETPYDPGLLYEWNSKVGMTDAEYSEAIRKYHEDWDGTVPTFSAIWEKANDPCPKGWHVPPPAAWATLTKLEYSGLHLDGSANFCVKSDISYDKRLVLPAGRIINSGEPGDGTFGIVHYWCNALGTLDSRSYGSLHIGRWNICFYNPELPTPRIEWNQARPGIEDQYQVILTNYNLCLWELHWQSSEPGAIIKQLMCLIRCIKD
jgi:hypothetical protein